MFISDELHVLGCEIIEVLDVRIEPELRRWIGFVLPGQLLFHGFHMILIDMRIVDNVGHEAWFQTRDLSQHAC